MRCQDCGILQLVDFVGEVIVTCHMLISKLGIPSTFAKGLEAWSSNHLLCISKTHMILSCVLDELLCGLCSITLCFARVGGTLLHFQVLSPGCTWLLFDA